MIFYWFIQNFIVWPLAWVILRFFYTIRINGRENLGGVKPPVIIVSNHKTLLDGFLIVVSFPWLSPILPGRYMTEEFEFRARALRILSRLKLLRFFYFLTGGFPSLRGQGIEKAIETPVKILKKGGTILMFPEGKLIREDALGQFYHGASALALVSGAPLLPVFIKVRPRSLYVTFGKVFKLGTTWEEGTNEIKEKIQELAIKTPISAP